MSQTTAVSERSFAPLTLAHLIRLAEIASTDREDRLFGGLSGGLTGTGCC